MDAAAREAGSLCRVRTLDMRCALYYFGPQCSQAGQYWPILGGFSCMQLQGSLLMPQHGHDTTGTAVQLARQTPLPVSSDG